MWVRNASNASKPGRSRPSMWSTVWIRRRHLDLPPPDDPDRAGHADPGLVVAVHVGAHGQLGLLFSGAEQGGDVRGVLQGVLAARDGAGDRAGLHPVSGDPHVHLGRRADQVLPLPQVEQELVRGRVTLPQQLVERGRRAAPPVEGVARHHLEQVAAGEPLPRLLDHPRIAPRSGGGGRSMAERAGVRPRVGACGHAVKPGRRLAVHLELVGVPDRLLARAVQDPDLVGQVQDQVPLLAGRSRRGRTGSNWKARS